MAEPVSPFTETPDGVRIRVRLTPKAGRNQVHGLLTDASGQGQLKVSVTAVPEKGKANKALLKLLAKEWHVGMRRLDLIAGHKDRNKTVLIAGDGASIQAKLNDWLTGLE